MSTPKRVLDAIDARDGHTCVWYGYDTGRLVPQHRQGGMGGRRNKHRLSNVVWLDSIVNGLLEADADMAAEARRRGIKISLHADPRLVPVLYPDGLFYWLLDDGERVPVGDDVQF